MVRKTRFNIFESQGDQRQLMQETSVGTLHRKLDDDIITQLDTATTTLGAATTMSLAVCAKAITKLGENNVPIDDADNLFAVATPAVMGYIMQLPEFSSHDYVETKPLVGPARRTLRWGFFNWIFHTGLTGIGTASEKCYFYHRKAIGSCFDSQNLNTAIGYDDEQDYSYARATSFIGSKLLQQNGIVQFLHDASAI